MWSRERRGILNRTFMLPQIREKRIEPDITVVELAGRLARGRESQRFEALIGELFRKGELRVILDMTRVDYMDSAGAGLIALAAGKLAENDGELVLVAPEGRALELLKLTRLPAIVKVCPTVGEAADVFPPPPPLEAA